MAKDGAAQDGAAKDEAAEVQRAPTRQARNRLRTRRRILDAGMGLFTTQGYEKTTIQEIADAEDAARVGFAGSPTVLVDGIDPFDRPGAGAGFACRLYRTGSGNEGAPSLDQLCVALAPT